VVNSALKLRSLVEAMTNMNLMQLGAAKLELTPLPIQRVIQLACDEIMETAAAKGTG